MPKFPPWTYSDCRNKIQVSVKKHIHEWICVHSYIPEKTKHCKPDCLNSDPFQLVEIALIGWNILQCWSCLSWTSSLCSTCPVSSSWAAQYIYIYIIFHVCERAVKVQWTQQKVKACQLTPKQNVSMPQNRQSTASRFWHMSHDLVPCI